MAHDGEIRDTQAHVKPPGGAAIRSFVRREGRLTPGQARALSEHWPRYGLEADRPAATPAAFFDRVAPCHLEVGFGDGETLLEQARSHPEIDFLGIEVYRPGIGRLLRRAAETEITNLRVFHANTLDIMRWRLQPACLDRVSVFFPDPWPKKRHHKRRLIGPEFTALAVRVLKPAGELWLATDWPDYAAHMLAVMRGAPDLHNLAPRGGFYPPRPRRPLTKFERRGQNRGHTITDLRFRRRDG